MTNQELVTALRQNMVETGSLICLGCGYEHSCAVRGCAIMREAADALEAQSAQLAERDAEIERLRLQRPIAVDGNAMALALELAEIKTDLAQMTAEKNDLRNELCQRCGNYRMAHKGACDGCRWRTPAKQGKEG